MSLYSNYYLLSKNVRVYPCSFRGQATASMSFDPEARLNTEANLTAPGAIGNVNTSYVIGYDSAHTLRCVIGGYYFELYNFELADLKNGTETKKLYIKTRSVEFNTDTPDQHLRSTKVLASFYDDTTTALDINVGNEYIFVGLRIDAEEPVGATAGLEVIELDENNQAKIKEGSYLPKVYHGKGEDAIILSGGYADGQGALAHGNLYTKATGDFATAIGQGQSDASPLEAAGTNSFVIGYANRATGNQAFAGGDHTIASGTNALTFGTATQATGNNSVAFGEYTLADKQDLVVLGKYNETTDNDLFIIGDGTADAARHNAIEVNKDFVKINLTTEITGRTSITGDTIITGDAVSITALTDIIGDTGITGNVSVSGDIQAGEDLTVGGEANITGITTIQNDLSASGHLTIGSGAEITGNAVITGTTTSAGKLTVNNGGASIKGNTTITGNTAITGTANIVGDTDITGDLTVNSGTVNTDRIKIHDKVTLWYDESSSSFRISIEE